MKPKCSMKSVLRHTVLVSLNPQFHVQPLTLFVIPFYQTDFSIPLASLSAGVHLGSVLDPILFSRYTNNLSSVLTCVFL